MIMKGITVAFGLFLGFLVGVFICLALGVIPLC